METLTKRNFEHFSLGGVDTLTIKIQKQKFFGRVGGPFKLKFANHFIIYQKRPFRGRFGPDRLHSELWAWGVKVSALSTVKVAKNSTY